MNEQINELFPCWTFDKLNPGETERNSLGEQFFVNDTRLAAIVRESIQNSLDAQANKNEPVIVRFYFSGERDKLPAKSFEKYWNGGESRFTNIKNGLTFPIPSKEDDCLFLVVEDFNTTGLTGVIDEKPAEEDVSCRNDWNYYNYFFRENSSTKEGAQTLGSWGTGKCVFQRASKLKMSFAYSIRDGYEPRKFLAGKATLKNHSDDSRITWKPDGWFGLYVDEDLSHPEKMRKRPITNDIYISSFLKDFNLIRRDEPGTSIVIPHIHFNDENAEFNEKNLARSILSNFLIAIFNNKLVVKVQVGRSGKEIIIDKNALQTYSLYLPSPEEKTPSEGKRSYVTSLHRDIVLEAYREDFPENQKFKLNLPNESRKWSDVMFDKELLKNLKKELNKDKTCLITVPTPIYIKDETDKIIKKEAEFQVILKHADLPKALPPVFYRAGLLVDEVVTAMPMKFCIAVVVIGRDELGKFLVAAEPPSHSNWTTTDKVKKEYDKPSLLIQYVVHSVRRIQEYIASCDREANKELLSDIFGIKKPKKDEGKKTGIGSSKETGKEEVEEAPDLPRKRRIVGFSEINGTLKGIKVFSDEGLLDVATQKFPFKVKFLVGYDTFHGLNWSPHDFNLSTGFGGISIDAIEGSIGITCVDNKVTFEIYDNKPFSVKIVGFDQNRDIIVDKLTYEYSKEDDNGASI